MRQIKVCLVYFFLPFRKKPNTNIPNPSIVAVAGSGAAISAEKERSSIAIPLSTFPESCGSVQRSQRSVPGCQLRPVIVTGETTTRFAALLPSSVPAVAVAFGDVHDREATLTIFDE